jgi:hypothetical protein
MEELARFMQLRQVQKLSEEYAEFLGLKLYPENKLSSLAKKIIDIGCSKDKFESIIKALNEKDKKSNGTLLISTLDQMDPVVRSLYNWFDYKARPIKIDDFKQHVQSIQYRKVDLQTEWIRYADSFILNVNNKLSANNEIDFQLLIRVCQIFKLCLHVENNNLTVIGEEELINELLTKPIIIPKGLLQTRCCERDRPNSKNESIIRTIDPKALVGKGDGCDCNCNEGCQKPSQHCICIRPYMSDLFIIKEELHKYVEGDIAHIENILAGENKVRKHRNLYRTEDSIESETETLTSEERDHQVSEKSSLKSEVQKTIDSKVGLDAGVTATIKYGSRLTITPHANVTADFSKSTSESTARSYAKDVVDRSVSKLQEKVRKVSISKVINELEEKNRHTIDNSEPGSSHRAGIYYWVNKVTRAQVFNYGKRMMFDVIVPEPAALFKKLFELKSSNKNDKQRPEMPQLSLSDIKRDEYLGLLNSFGISGAIEPPDAKTAIQIGIHQNLTEPPNNVTTGFSSSEFKSEQIPDGYKATSFDFSISCYIGDPAAQKGSDEASVSVAVGKSIILKNVKSQGKLNAINNWSGSGKNIDMNDEQGVITAVVAGYSSVAMSLSGTISIKCELTTEAFDKWKVQIYNYIMDDYNRKLELYEASEVNNPLIQIKGRNPFLNREIERNELKRHIIAILMCNYFNGMGSMNEVVAPCGYPEPDFEKLEKDTPYIQFFEQVFEWNYITYLFYHSMWARKCKWPELIDEDSGDPLFDKFLMSGASRVQIPVRPEMQDVFYWFLKTGQIWGESGIPPVSGDSNYISMIQELKEAKQGDFTDRPGAIATTKDSDKLKLTGSTYYWDFVNNQINPLNIANDIDREILIDYELYRILKVSKDNVASNSEWTIIIDKPFKGESAANLKHAMGAQYVGAPWEIVIPTKLVYLKNDDDKLPVYPLT